MQKNDLNKIKEVIEEEVMFYEMEPKSKPKSHFIDQTRNQRN